MPSVSSVSRLAGHPAAKQALGRRARRHAETREGIVRAALKLFARQGFFATTVEQITQAADVGKGTFFNYFPSKEHVLTGFGEIQLAKVRGALEGARERTTPIRVVARQLLLALAEMRVIGTPAPVVINEAVDLAKKYGTEDSGRFVNGMLGKIVRDWEQSDRGVREDGGSTDS